MFDYIISSRFRTTVLFFILGFICYGYILNTTFKLLDDFACIVTNPAIQSLSQWPELFKTSFFNNDASYYRPLVSLSFMLEFHFFRFESFIYNFDNILLHVLTALLVLASLTIILKDKKWAFFAALLFLIHPVNWEQITNIPGRSILLCAFFFMAAFYCLLKSIERKITYPGFGVDDVLSVTAFAAALLSKESAVVFPMIVVCLMIFIYRRDIRSAVLTALPYFGILAGYVGLRLILGITNVKSASEISQVVLAVATFLKSLGVHAMTLLFPRDLIYDRSLKVMSGFDAPQFWIVLAIAAAVAISILICRYKINRLSWFLLAWIALGFFPVSQLVPIYVSTGYISIADHFLYLPSVAIFVFLVQGVRMFFEIPAVNETLRPKVQRILLLVWIGFLVIVTFLQTIVASDQFVMFETALEANPSDNRVRTALASAYGYAGLPKKAEEHFREVLKYTPWDAKARIGLGKALCDQNECLQALVEYHNVINPSAVDVELLEDNLKKTYPIIIRDYENRLKRSPDDPEIIHVLGMAYVKTGRIEEGILYLKRALAINPDFPKSLFLLAGVLETQGEYKVSAELYQKFLNVVPQDEHFARANAMEHLAQFYASQELNDDAQRFNKMAEQEKSLMQAVEPLRSEP